MKLGFRESLDILFDCRPSVRTILRVRDEDGEPTMGSFLIRDGVQRSADEWEASYTNVYPLPARRLASRDEYPDFFFQHQTFHRAEEILQAWTKLYHKLPPDPALQVPRPFQDLDSPFQIQSGPYQP